MSHSDESVWDAWQRKRQEGEADAVEELIRRSEKRLERLARKMLRSYPGVRRWEETGDVLQESLVRLSRALRECPPSDARHFFNLATVQIRRTLIDLARRHQGPLGIAANHDTVGGAQSGIDERLHQGSRPSNEPASMDEWTAFHEAVEDLPEREKEVFQLTWYQGLSQKESAELLQVDERTIRRYWQAAKVELGRRLQKSSENP